MLKFITHYMINAMKTITLTDEQFDTLFEYVDNKVTTIVDASVDYQDSQILEDTKIEYEKKLEKARAKQPKAEW